MVTPGNTRPSSATWHLHEGITRNHRCQTIDELVELAFDWFGYKQRFDIETSIYVAVRSVQQVGQNRTRCAGTAQQATANFTISPSLKRMTR
jgi:hypothetical protein